MKISEEMAAQQLNQVMAATISEVDCVEHLIEQEIKFHATDNISSVSEEFKNGFLAGLRQVRDHLLPTCSCQQWSPIQTPKGLDAIADVVLNYRPKSKQPKPRKRKKAKAKRAN